MIDATTSIEDVLPLELINVSMKAASREEVLEAFADMFEAAGCLSNRDQFLKDAWWREGEGPTGVSDGIAIPHSKSAGVSKTSLAVGRIPKAIEWPSLDEGPCRAFVMFAVRSDDQNQEVHLLSKVAVALCHKEVVETLLTSDDPEAIRCALGGEENNE